MTFLPLFDPEPGFFYDMLRIIIEPTLPLSKVYIDEGFNVGAIITL